VPSWIVTEPPPSGIRVREATAADLPRIVELLAQLSLDEPAEAPGEPLAEGYRAAFREIEADSRQRLLVVDVAGRVQGTAVMVIVANLGHQGRPYAVVENVVVDAQRRSGGLGALLMQHTVELAREAGCYKVVLTSNKRRPDAHRFYERLGFQAKHEGFRLDL